MPAKTPTPPPDPTHQRQTFWMIAFPLGIVTLIVLVLAILSLIYRAAPAATVTRWSYVSTIFLVLQAGFMGLIALVVLAGLIYLLARLLNVLPTYTRQAQRFLERVSQGTRRAADQIAHPVVEAKSAKTAVETLFHRLKKDTSRR